jgi:hypothetical protein
MANIYDNIESKFVQGLQELITDDGIKRVDFCVGYFNLRGWDLVVNRLTNCQESLSMRMTNRSFVAAVF